MYECAGKPKRRSLFKPTVAVLILAYEYAADTCDDSYQVEESTALEFLDRFL